MRFCQRLPAGVVLGLGDRLLNPPGKPSLVALPRVSPHPVRSPATTPRQAGVRHRLSVANPVGGGQSERASPRSVDTSLKGDGDGTDTQEVRRCFRAGAVRLVSDGGSDRAAGRPSKHTVGRRRSRHA